MNLLLRLLWTFLASRFRPRLELLEDSVLNFRVLPNDLDLNVHMNNGRYLSLMDLGRMDMTLRTGLGRAMVKGRWKPLVGAVTMRYRRGLEPFEAYELHTRLLGWDAKWFYLEQRFMKGGDVAAEGVVRALFRGPKGNVATADVAAVLGLSPESPGLPESLSAWIESLDRRAVPENSPQGP